MTFYRLQPEVAGGWGPNTRFTRTPGRPVVVHRLHYVFDGWLGDELLESGSCFIVTRRLAQLLTDCRLSGFELRPVEISQSELFDELYPDRLLPAFEWLQVTGESGVDDFGVDEGYGLVVSKSALEALKRTNLTACQIAAVE